MGNMPNKWLGRAAAFLLAVGAAFAGGFGARWVAERLTFGFTFDWYVHQPHGRYAVTESLLEVSGAATAAAVLAALTLAGPTYALVRFLMKRLRYSPPQYAEPTGFDMHLAKTAMGVSGVGLLSALALYVYFNYPVDWQNGGFVVDTAYTTLKPSGHVLLMTAAGALGAFVGAYVTLSTTYVEAIDGRLVPKTDRNLIARISIFGMKNAWTTLALVVATTLVAGSYAASITTNVDVADVLPRGDPNTEAAHNLTDKFKSSFTQQVTFQFRILDPDNATAMDLFERENREKLPNRVSDVDTATGEVGRPWNITDELYVRAIDEMITFVVNHEKYPFAGSSGAHDIYKLTNWTLAGGDTDQNREGDKAFSIPSTEPNWELQYNATETGIIRLGALYAAVDALTSPTWRQTAVLVTVDPGADIPARDIGRAGLEVRDAWLKEVREGRTTYTVFGDANPPQFTVDLPIANAHASELTQRDFRLLLPIIAVFIAVTLFIAFRNLVSVAATFSMLAIAVTWTFGVMGYMDIPLNTLNLAVVPLIMGVGIDYGIHMMNEYQELRHHGKSPEEAWRDAGGGSALALFVGLLTTLAGLAVMVVSPSLLVAQLGLLAIVALISCYVLAILFIPALVTVLGGGAKSRKKVEFTPSRVMPGIASGVSRMRWAVLAVLVLLAGAAIASASTLHREAFGDPPRNWLESDPLRQEHERALSGFYDTTSDDVKANVLIFEGDITDPDTHTYITGITNTLRQNSQRGYYIDQLHNDTNKSSRIIGDTLKDVPFIMNTYLTVRGGAPGAGQFLGAGALGPLLESRGIDDQGQTETYPKTRAEIKQTLDAVFASPLYQFGNIFIDHPDYDMAVTIFSVRAATYEDAAAVWDEVQAAIDANKDLKPEGMQVSFFGNTAINYLFVAKQVPWLTYMSIATNIIVVLIVFLFTRDIRATVLVGACNFLTSTLWLGVLPIFGIGLAINLTLPLVFIFCMGSDYGLHLAMRCRKTGDTYLTMQSVGKGVLYSFITTFGAFVVFTQISDLAGRRGMIATAIAIATVFATTLLAVPVFYPVRKKDRERHGGAERNVPVVERRATSAPQVIPAAPRQAPAEDGGPPGPPSTS